MKRTATTTKTNEWKVEQESLYTQGVSLLTSGFKHCSSFSPKWEFKVELNIENIKDDINGD